MYQNIILVGIVGKEPEMRYTPAGKAAASFRLATSESYWKGEDKSESVTTWWTVTCWGQTAERVYAQVKKGMKLLVEGRIKPGDDGNPRKFTRKDGSTGTTYEMTASVVRILDKIEKSEPEGDEEVMW